MSNVALSQTVESAGVGANPAGIEIRPVDVDLPGVGGEAVPSEFDYRPVPIAAPVSLFLGFCSSLGLFTIVGLGLGLFGTLLGAICLLRIRQSKGELGGTWIAAAGCVMSLAFLISGTTLHAYTFATEVPEGFRRVNFTHDISKKLFVTEGDYKKLHPDVAALNGQQVFIKGYMYPEKTTKNLTSFLLVKDNQQCCFGGQPNLNDMIMVTMQKGKKMDYHRGLVSIAGTFRTAATQGPAGLLPIYSVEAIQAEKARTNF